MSLRSTKVRASKRATETKAFQELKARRTEGGFNELAGAWWWFEDIAKLAHAANAVAWEWEILRRAAAYREFHRTAKAVRKADERLDGIDLVLDFGRYWSDLRELAASN